MGGPRTWVSMGTSQVSLGASPLVDQEEGPEAQEGEQQTGRREQAVGQGLLWPTGHSSVSVARRADCHNHSQQENWLLLCTSFVQLL